jgi:hypothetical protein
MAGTVEHLPVIADCERGRGRPEKAIEIATGPEAATLTGQARLEMALVLAGARADRGEYEAGLAVLAAADRAAGNDAAHDRIAEARERLAALQGGADPQDWEWAEEDENDWPVIVVDTLASDDEEDTEIDEDDDDVSGAVDPDTDRDSGQVAPAATDQASPPVGQGESEEGSVGR